MRRQSLVHILAVAVLLPVASAVAQEGKPPMPATDIKSPEIQEAVKRGIAALTPGVTVNDRLVNVADLMNPARSRGTRGALGYARPSQQVPSYCSWVGTRRPARWSTAPIRI